MADTRLDSDVDGGMVIDIDNDVNSYSDMGVSGYIPPPTACSFPALTAKAFIGQATSTSGEMDVDIMPSNTKTVARAGGGTQQDVAVLTSSVLSTPLAQKQTQPRALVGSQSLPAPASPSSSPSPPPSPSPLTPQSPENRTSSSELSSSGTASTSSSSSSSAVHGELPSSRTMSTSASTVGDAAPPPPPPPGTAVASLSRVPVPAIVKVDDVGDLNTDDEEDRAPIPALDKGKGKEKSDEGGEQEEDLVISKGFFNKADFDFDWDEEADRFYNGEYDDEFGGYYEDAEEEDDSDYWDSEEDEYSDEEDESDSESEGAGGNGAGKEKKKSKIKVLDEFGFDMLSFARMLIESGEMEKIQQEARQASTSPSPSSEPLDPDFPEIDDMDDVSIEEINKQLKGLKIVKFERISENAEKFTFDWTDSGGEEEEGREKEKEVKEVQETNVPRLVVTDASPPQSPVRKSTALPGVNTAAATPASAASTSSIRPPSSSFTFTFTLPPSKPALAPPSPFPPQTIPASERLKVPPAQYTGKSRRAVLERAEWERRVWEWKREKEVRGAGWEVSGGNARMEGVEGVGDKEGKEGRVMRRLPRKFGAQRRVVVSGGTKGEPMKFTFSWPAVPFAQQKPDDVDVDMDKHRDPTARMDKALFKGRKRRGRPINANVTLDIKSRELWKKILAPHPRQPAQDKFATAKAQLEESKLGVEDMRERVNALLGMVVRSPKAKRRRRGREEEEEGEEREERKFTFRAPIAFPNPFVNTATSASTPKKKVTGSAPDSPPRKHVRKHSTEKNPDRNPNSNSNTDLNLPSNLKRASGTAQPEPMDAMRKWRTQKKEKTKRRKEMRRVKEFFLVGLEERGMEDRKMGDVFGEREGVGLPFGAKGKEKARAREEEIFDSDMRDSEEDSDSDMESVAEPARPLSGSDLTSWR